MDHIVSVDIDDREDFELAEKARKKAEVKRAYEDFRSLKNDPELPEKIAAELGLDVGRLIEDMKSKEISDLIDYEYSQLTALRNAYPETEEYSAGVRIAVPKFFINGREPAGRSVAQWSVMIDEELKK